jgi:hypothetical protein
VVICESCSCLWKFFSDFHDHLLILFCSVLCLSFYLRSSCSPWSIPCSLFVFGFESSGRIAPVSVSTCVGSEAGVLSSHPQVFHGFHFLAHPFLVQARRGRQQFSPARSLRSATGFFSHVRFRSGLHLCRWKFCWRSGSHAGLRASQFPHCSCGSRSPGSDFRIHFRSSSARSSLLTEFSRQQVARRSPHKPLFHSPVRI